MPDYHLESNFDPHNKDHKIRMARYLVHEIGELQAVTRKVDREALKSAITEQYIIERSPYGRYEMRKPVIVSFAGTINNTGVGFLSDPSGHRRYAVVKSQGIDWNYARHDKRMIWAELMHLYFDQGERGMLTPDEIAYRDEHNQNYEQVSHIAEQFDEHFIIDRHDARAADGMTSTKIISILAGRVGGNITDQNKRMLEEHLTKLARDGRIPTRTRPRVDGQRRFVYTGFYARETKDCTCIGHDKGCPICNGHGWTWVDMVKPII